MIKMGKSSILYICGKKFSPILECFEWYEVFKNTLENGVNMEKNKIETPFALIEIVRRKPLFSGKYDFVLNANKQDDTKLFAIGIGKDY